MTPQKKKEEVNNKLYQAMVKNKAFSLLRAASFVPTQVFDSKDKAAAKAAFRRYAVKRPLLM